MAALSAVATNVAAAAKAPTLAARKSSFAARSANIAARKSSNSDGGRQLCGFITKAEGVSSGKSAPPGTVMLSAAEMISSRKPSGRGENHDHFYENHGPGYFSYGGLDVAPGERYWRNAYFEERTKIVAAHFENAIGMDDFMFRVESILSEYDFAGDNSIALTSFCRDEVTFPLRNAIHDVFGYTMDIDGLGGVITCGTTGLGAAFSHSPNDFETGKERYVFFAMPHIAIDSSGDVGGIIRPGRMGRSCACGALLKLQPKFKEHREGKCDILGRGLHDSMDPEYSILEARMLRKIRPDEIPEEGLSLVEVTQLCDRVIRDDLNALISAVVNPEKADYAVITGVQIHSYGHDEKVWHPNMEYVCPTSMYVVRNGKRYDIDVIKDAKPPTPRQLFRMNGGSTVTDTPEVMPPAGSVLPPKPYKPKVAPISDYAPPKAAAAGKDEKKGIAKLFNM